jgi:hypothetical protein
LEMLILGSSWLQGEGATCDSSNSPPLAFGLSNQERGTCDSAAGQLGSNVAEDSKFCVGSKMKVKSAVWNDIDRVKIRGELKGSCKWCKKPLSVSTKNGTNHLRRHINSCQRRMAAKAATVQLKTVDGRIRPELSVGKKFAMLVAYIRSH